MTPNTICFWMTLIGFKPGRVGAWAWFLMGVGSAGLAWERATNSARITSFDKRAVSPRFLATHLPQLILGGARLWRTR